MKCVATISHYVNRNESGMPLDGNLPFRKEVHFDIRKLHLMNWTANFKFRKMIFSKVIYSRWSVFCVSVFSLVFACVCVCFCFVVCLLVIL